MPRWVDAKRVTFKYGLGDEFIDVLKTLHKLGLDRTDHGRGARAVQVVTARRRGGGLPDPAQPRRPDERQDLRRACGSRAPARTAAAARCTSTTWSTTSGRCAEYGAQAVVWQTAINPVVALELLAERRLVGRGRARPRGVRRRPVPRPAARGLRPAVGHAGARPADPRGLRDWLADGGADGTSEGPERLDLARHGDRLVSRPAAQPQRLADGQRTAPRGRRGPRRAGRRR